MNLKKYFLIPFLMLLLIVTCISKESRSMSEYVGSESCIECHGDSFGSLKANPHMITADPGRPGAVNGCESCHGPGSSHAETGDAEDILTFGSRSLITQDIKNEACLKCHENGKQALWHGSEHDSRGVSCSDCHKIHLENEVSAVNKQYVTPDDQCLKCHARVKSETMRQSHHPIREGKIKCTDCHNPHGTISDNLIDAQQTNLKCFECHEEKRGPFLWEHPPVTEDCLTCHTAHGSTHSPLLETKAPYLCQRCHSDQDHSGDLYANDPAQPDRSVYQSGPNYLFYRACLNCHVSIHGSNHPSGKSLLR